MEQKEPKKSREKDRKNHQREVLKKNQKQQREAPKKNQKKNQWHPGFAAAIRMELKENGYRVQNPYPGIYYVSGSVMFRVQILVTKNLDKTENIWLHSLRRNITRET